MVSPDLQPRADHLLRLGAWSLQASPADIASRTLGGSFTLMKEQAPSLINLRRSLLERQLDGFPLCDEIVRVNWLSDGTVMVHGAVSTAQSWSGSDQIGAAYAGELAAQIFTAEWPTEVVGSRLELLPLADGARLCHRVDLVSSASTSIGYRVWVDAEHGHRWQVRNQSIHANGQAAVFMPNPVETLDNPNLTDQRDSGTAVPAAAYFPVTLEDLDGSGYMTGTWATTDRTPNRSFRANLNFTNDRQGRIFEEALSYYHVTAMQHYLQGLGLNARRSQQPINVFDLLFGIFEYTNASYNSLNGVISFGTRGVDCAEDADVVIHEYGHAIHDDVQGGIGNGENGAMSEGYGDWLSSVHSNDALTGEWVGVTLGTGIGFPAVRRADEMKQYPEDKVGQVHSDGEIWSATLWEIGLMIGPDAVTQLVIEAMSTMTRNTQMPRAGELLVLAEDLLTSGSNLAYVAGPLARTGLIDLPVDMPRLEASRRALRTGDDLTFRLSSPTHAGSNFQTVLSQIASPTASGPPFNSTLDIGTDMLGLSLSMQVLSGQLDANGNATFAMTIPPGLTWKDHYFAQAMILDGSNQAVALSLPIAFRAERH
ncbi:MAG: M36 family metallopeptidase [Planctomycetota bacterium]|nr:M36 family metallopeptidase [Planctomycetota bacterium]